MSLERFRFLVFLQQIASVLVDRGQFWRYDDFEAVADVGLDRTEAEARLVDTQLAGSEVVGETDFHLVPVYAAEESDSILYAVADASPEEVLVLQKT